MSSSHGTQIGIDVPCLFENKIVPKNNKNEFWISQWMEINLHWRQPSAITKMFEKQEIHFSAQNTNQNPSDRCFPQFFFCFSHRKSIMSLALLDLAEREWNHLWSTCEWWVNRYTVKMKFECVFSRKLNFFNVIAYVSGWLWGRRCLQCAGKMLRTIFPVTDKNVND